MVDENRHGKISRVGQLIGEAFEKVVIGFIKYFLRKNHPGFVILKPEEGRKLLTLVMPGGVKRQLDTVVASTNSEDPIALLETKWLKDGRHWNDKGAWILQLREFRRNYPTVRGASAILAGHWNEGVRVYLKKEGGGIDMILAATDEDVYHSLQHHLDKYLGEKSFILNAKQIRTRFPEERVNDFLDFLTEMQKSGQLYKIAKTWLNIEHESKDGQRHTGKNLIQISLDGLLLPLPEHLNVNKFEVTFEIQTGNLIHKVFNDLEEMLEFINQTARDPEKIREIISPKQNRKIGEQIALYDIEEDDNDW